ncbi:hypothetical protein GOBAR_DD19924 [Gossypium barbadense]|nr:hypothetical protein GOBAR_DD19924 [Gossypium barbadense]
MATPSLGEDTAKAVLRQVEFYFGDSNLPKDDFLKTKINESEDDMVCLALICSFSKMRGHLNLTEVKKADDVPDCTLKVVAQTLRTSSSLKVSEDGKKVGRSTKLLEPEELIEQLDSRTIAASPLELNVNSVRLPRHVVQRKYFCGTALIEFSAVEDAQTVLEQSLVFAGAEQELKPKKDFDVIREKEVEEFERNRSIKTSNGSNAEEKHPKGLLVAFKLKSASAGDSAEQNGPDEKKTAEMKMTKKVDDKHGSPIDKVVEKENKSSISIYKDDMNVVLREDLKDVFKKFGTVKYVDFRIREDKGYIRFEQPEAAQKAHAASVSAKGGLVVKNFIANVEPVIFLGVAESEYWSLLRGNQGKHRVGNHFHWRGGKNNRGGKRGRDGENGSPRGRPNEAKRARAA